MGKNRKTEEQLVKFKPRVLDHVRVTPWAMTMIIQALQHEADRHEDHGYPGLASSERDLANVLRGFDYTEGVDMFPLTIPSE